MPERVEIRELDPDSITPTMAQVMGNQTGKGSKIVVIGKPGTGKTRLISSLIFEKRQCFPVGVVMSGTEDSNSQYSTMFPSTFVFDALDMDVLQNFIKRQKIALKFTECPWALVLLDDCTDDPRMFRSPLFQGIFKNGRHWALFFIMSLQYCIDVPPAMRVNVDGCFILRETNLRSRKQLYENYAGVIPSFKLFCEIMDQITNDYTALFIHNQVQSNDWRRCVFWYRARPVPENWKFGSRDYWAFHRARFNADHRPSFM